MCGSNFYGSDVRIRIGHLKNPFKIVCQNIAWTSVVSHSDTSYMLFLSLFETKTFITCKKVNVSEKTFILIQERHFPMIKVDMLCPPKSTLKKYLEISSWLVNHSTLQHSWFGGSSSLISNHSFLLTYIPWWYIFCFENTSN